MLLSQKELERLTLGSCLAFIFVLAFYLVDLHVNWLHHGDWRALLPGSIVVQIVGAVFLLRFCRKDLWSLARSLAWVCTSRSVSL